jgi:hypothetical protein
MVLGDSTLESLTPSVNAPLVPLEHLLGPKICHGFWIERLC